MELYAMFEKWKVNHNLVASLMDMPKGTFNNKLSPNHFSDFTSAELIQLKKILKEMGDDLLEFTRTYNEVDEVLIHQPDEPIIYNGKEIKEDS